MAKNIYTYLLLICISFLLGCNEPEMELVQDNKVLCPGNIWVEAKTSFTESELQELLFSHPWKHTNISEYTYKFNKRRGSFCYDPTIDHGEIYVVYLLFLTENKFAIAGEDVEDHRMYFINHPEECGTYHIEGNIIYMDDDEYNSKYTVIGYTDETIFTQVDSDLITNKSFAVCHIFGNLPY